MKNIITKEIEYMKYVLGYKRGVVISEQQSTEGCIKGNCVNGQGTYKWPDGSVYTGQYKDGVKNGQGTYKNKNGVKFSGIWVNGALNGKRDGDLDKIKPTKKPSNNATEPNNAQSNLNCVKPTEPTHRYKNDRNYQYAKSGDCWWAKNIINDKWYNLTDLVNTKPKFQSSIDRLNDGTDLIAL